MECCSSIMKTLLQNFTPKPSWASFESPRFPNLSSRTKINAGCVGWIGGKIKKNINIKYHKWLKNWQKTDAKCKTAQKKYN